MAKNVEFGSQIIGCCTLWKIKHFSLFTVFWNMNAVTCNQINTTGATSEAGTPELTPGFQWGSCYSIFSFMCMFCRSLFVLLYIFFWPLCCLFFFDIQILITPLVSSNSSYILLIKNVSSILYISCVLQVICVRLSFSIDVDTVSEL